MVERQILFQLSPDDIENLCSIDETYNRICQEDSFWSEYFYLKNKVPELYPSKIQWYGDQYYRLEQWLCWLKSKSGDRIIFMAETLDVIDSQYKRSFKILINNQNWKKFWDIISIDGGGYLDLDFLYTTQRYKIYFSYDITHFGGLLEAIDNEDEEALEGYKKHFGEKLYNEVFLLYGILSNYGGYNSEDTTIEEEIYINKDQMKTILRKFLNHPDFLSGDLYFVDSIDEKIILP